MSRKTIAGDIRRIRSLMRLGPDIGSCVIRKSDYTELLKLFDSIETKAKRMHDALRPVLECKQKAKFGGLVSWGEYHDAQEVISKSQRIYNGVNHD